MGGGVSDVAQMTEAQQAAKDFADAILDLSDAAEAMLGAGLTTRAIVVLLDDKLGSDSPGKRVLYSVLAALPNLREYVV